MSNPGEMTAQKLHTCWVQAVEKTHRGLSLTKDLGDKLGNESNDRPMPWRGLAINWIPLSLMASN